MGDTLNIGIVGAGGFAHFAAHAFVKVADVKIAAVNDVNESAAKNLASEFNVKVYNSYEALLNDRDIHLVYIATPPFLHYPQSRMAIEHGKHVICEKPAALHANEAEELAAIATNSKLLYVVNLMQRYNPLFEMVRTIINEKLIGNFLHGFFENYASDENLGPDHWFWNDEKSGGIFIEHGVHFFDLFAGWLGEGKLLNAIRLQRPDSSQKIYDRLQATVEYEGGIVNFYHGFDQPKILDRQEMRLQFEQGEIILYEWVPVKMKLHGLLTNEQLQRLNELLVDFTIEHHQPSSQQVKKVKGRFTEILFNDHVTIEYGSNTLKQKRYEEILIAMLTDQLKWIRDRNHRRVINDRNAVESLRIAEEAANFSKMKIES